MFENCILIAVLSSNMGSATIITDQSKYLFKGKDARIYKCTPAKTKLEDTKAGELAAREYFKERNKNK